MYFKLIHNKEVHLYNPKGNNSFQALQAHIKSVFKKLPAKYQLTYIDQDNDEITLINNQDLQVLYDSSVKTVKILIKQIDEAFYDQTQEVQLDDEMEKIEQGMEEMEIKSESEYVKELQVSENEGSLKNQSVLDDSVIEEKIKKMLPGLINQVKEEMTSQSRIKSTIKSKQANLETQPTIVQEKTHIKLQQKSQPKYQAKNEKIDSIIHRHIICDQCQQNDIQGIRYKCAVCADFDLCQNCEANTNHDHPFLKIRHPRQAPYKLIAIIDDNHNSMEMNGQRVEPFNLSSIGQMLGAWTGNQNFGNMFKNRECPFRKKTEQKEQKKQKKEQKCQQKKVQPKVQQVDIKQSSQKKVKKEQQTGAEIKSESISQKQSENQMKEQRQAILMENATYLSDILDIDFNRCYKFASKHILSSKQELLEEYFANPASI